MPEVQEVFRMATNKVGPDRGFLERQHRRQRRRARNSKVGPFILLAAIVAGLVALAVVQSRGNANVPMSDADTPTQVLPQSGIESRYVDVRTGETTPGPVIPEADFEMFSVSADGGVVAYAAVDPYGEGNREIIYVADVDGTALSNVRPLVNAHSTRAEDIFALELSADGSKIVYQLQPGSTREEGDLYVADVRTGATTRITHLEQISSSYWFMRPTFSGDGKTVLFNAPRVSDTTHQVTWDLYSVPADGGEATLVRPNAILGSYSPDGTMIAYEKPGVFANEDLFVANADGTHPTRLVNGEVGWWSSWSPDGTTIAYSDFVTGEVLYVVDVQSGETSEVGTYAMAHWVGNHTMITDQQ